MVAKIHPEITDALLKYTSAIRQHEYASCKSAKPNKLYTVLLDRARQELFLAIAKHTK